MVFIEETVSSDYIYKGRILNLRKDKVKTVDGNVSLREIVEHNGGVGVVAVTDQGNVLMVSQFRKAFDAVIFEIPAGKIEKDEEPEKTAIRELKEETGYSAKEIELLTVMYPSVGYTSEKIYIYLCKGLKKGKPCFDDTEALEIAEVPLAQLRERVLRGEIEDGKTALGILMAWENLERGGNKGR